MDVKIRQLKDKEVIEVVDLFNVVFKEAYYGYPMSKKKLLQRLNNPNFHKISLALTYNTKMRGFILANVPKEKSKWYIPYKGYISLIMVHPNFRGRGLGKALLKEALDFLEKKEVNEVEISCNPLTFWPGIDSCWIEAIVFFEEMGFKEFKAASSMVTDLQSFKIPEKILRKEDKLKKKKKYLLEDI